MDARNSTVCHGTGIKLHFDDTGVMAVNRWKHFKIDVMCIFIKLYHRCVTDDELNLFDNNIVRLSLL